MDSVGSVKFYETLIERITKLSKARISKLKLKQEKFLGKNLPYTEWKFRLTASNAEPSAQKEVLNVLKRNVLTHQNVELTYSSNATSIMISVSGGGKIEIVF